MAFEPQRFIHAANIRLDVPVSVQTSETLTEELRFAFEDATLFAFDEVIDACIKRDVDFLLLSGNVFIEADRSLRARLALLKGFNKLNDKNIHVFVLPVMRSAGSMACHSRDAGQRHRLLQLESGADGAVHQGSARDDSFRFDVAW